MVAFGSKKMSFTRAPCTGLLNHTETKKGVISSLRVKDESELLPIAVTTCLTNVHDECTGTYVDTTNNFKIQCSCGCHTDRNRKGGTRK